MTGWALGLWLGANVGFVCGTWWCGRKHGEDRADAYLSGYRHGVTHGMVQGAVRQIARQPKDEGARLLADIADEYERNAAWAELGHIHTQRGG